MPPSSRPSRVLGNGGGAGSAHLTGLRALHLGENYIGPEGAAALAASPHLAGLTSFTLNYGIGGRPGNSSAGASATA